VTRRAGIVCFEQWFRKHTHEHSALPQQGQKTAFRNRRPQRAHGLESSAPSFVTV
jgi:hypothetical protein